jgi:DNA-binding LacI/PurR family transcriptional regulator
MSKVSMEGKKATLDDVARHTGFHRSTVSQVLNGYAKCWASTETRKQILAASKKLGYHPNPSARALRSGKTNLLGLVTPGFGVLSPRSRAGGLTDAAARQDYTVAVTSHPNDADSEDRVIRRLLNRGVDGLAIYPVDSGEHRELRALVARGFPVVTFDGASLLDFPCDDVSVDYAEVGRLQARHLLELGRRRVCLANTRPEARINALRENAIRAELKKAGAPAPLEMRVDRPASREFTEADPLEESIRAFLADRRGTFDALIGFDAMASLAIRVLQQLAIRIPNDVAVVGGGNSFLASYGVMPMTSISTADDYAGSAAFDLLLNRIDGRDNGPFKRLASPVQLISRDSTIEQYWRTA